MGDLWIQGLQLTMLGMGMTFASIGALVVGMYFMTAVTRGKRPRAEATLKVQRDGGEGVSVDSAALEGGHLSLTEESSGDAKYRAAVAAVAVALTEAEAQAPSIAPRVSDAAWDIYVRGQHVSRRMRYDLRQRRG